MEQAIIITLADALLSALNLGQLVHLARVNVPALAADEGEYEMEKITRALAVLAQWSPECYKAALS